MIVDNWAICPQCLHEAEKASDERLRAVEEGYGVIPREEWEALRAKAEESIDPESLRTFREDWDIYGADEGVVNIHYSGGCGKCGTRAKFQYAETFWTPS